MTPAAEALVLAHMEFVRRIAKHVAKSMPAWIEIADLECAGYLGLVEAASKYDQALNPSFEFYAYKFVRGRMIDPYRGSNYPRLTVGMPEEWLHDGQQNTCDGAHNAGPLPPALIDAAPSPDQQFFEAEQRFDLAFDLAWAERRLTGLEKRTLTRHARGKSMREVGAMEGKSGAWAHYTIHRAKKKMRAALKEYDKKAA